MSRTREEALFTDPLDALRAGDHRPLTERWREQLAGRLSGAGGLDFLRRGAVVFGAVALVIAVGWRLFVTSQPPVEDSLPIVQRNQLAAVKEGEVAAGAAVPVSLADSDVAPVPAVIVVHVAGAVRRPGVVQGAEGWRVFDALDAAGGAGGTADLDRINLAAPIADGQRIFVPTVGEPDPSVLGPTSAVNSGGGSTGLPVNINAADSAALELLPGVGPATAAAILAHRDEHGPFATVDALVAVRGIGPATLEGFRDLVVVS